MQSKHERGFSLIELLIVISIMAVIFAISIPFYRRYVAQTELKNVSQDLYLQLVTAHNNAVNGVVPKEAPTTNTPRFYWVVHIHQAGYLWEYESGSCALVADSASPGYTDQFGFTFCGSGGPLDYKYHTFPSRFSIEHEFVGSYNEANVYFEPISGQVSIYSIDGTQRLDNPADPTQNAINIKITSIDYPDLTITFHVNHQGTISQETSAN